MRTRRPLKHTAPAATELARLSASPDINPPGGVSAPPPPPPPVLPGADDGSKVCMEALLPLLARKERLEGRLIQEARLDMRTESRPLGPEGGGGAWT